MDRKKNTGFDDADEWDEADEPSGQAAADQRDESPTPSQDEYKDEAATAVFPDLPDIGSATVAGGKDRKPAYLRVDDKDVSDDEGPAPDQIPDFPDLEGIPKLTEGLTRVRGVDGQARTTRGDESVVETEGILSSVADEEKLPEDFFYNYADLVSKPKLEAKLQLPSTLLTLSHSFGYDCTHRANLHVVEDDVLVFLAGNYVVIMNVKTEKQVCIRSTGGRGIGAISVHPSKKYIAVGETGAHPDINIFEYPSLRLHRILRAGAERAYAFLDFSPNGSMLASMGAEPDFMLTLWNWKQEKIVLRCKAFSQDVFRVTFSAELLGQLTSCGIGHIRFWKMARTFTGLKLQGSLGRFGKREISDIEGCVELPDGKVLSSCESGNMLLWDDGLCINEICRKGRKPCHQGPIQQIIMDEGELITVGIDGYVRMWDFETTGNMQAEDESQAMELDPVNELRVGNDVQLTSMVRSCGPRELSLWYAQDASGGIWKLDLSFQFTSLQPERLMYYHSGPIFSCGASPVSHLVGTVGSDCTVQVYDFMARRLLCMAKFNSPATAFLWLPQKLDPDGATMLAGFDDGILRMLCLQKDVMAEVRKQDFKYELRLVFALKPHKSTLTCIEMDRNSELLVSGSSDGTVFFFDVLIDYAPIGFVKVSSSINHIAWSPANFSQATVLVSCADGKVFEVEVPVPSVCDTTKSYHLTLLKVRAFVFESIKSRLRHEEELARLAEEEKERKRLAQEEKQKLIDTGLWGPDDDDAEAEMEEKLQKEKKEKDKWEPVYPEKPSPVLCTVYGTEEGQFWVSMGAFDSGYFYECRFSETSIVDGETTAADVHRPIRAIPVVASNDVPVSQIIFSKNEKYAIMGMQDGCIRIQLLQEEGNFATLGSYWMLGVHDANYGDITHLCLSYDEKFLFSAGLDGNFFAFHFETRTPSELMIAASIPPDRKVDLGKDIEDSEALSIEDAKQKSEDEKMLMLAEKKKEATRQTVEQMKETFQEFHKRNNSLPPYLKLNKKEFDMNPEFVKEIQQEKEEKINLLNKEVAWNEEKQKIALDKLRSRFKDNCESEKTYLRAFTTPHVLANFRLARRSRYLKECLEELRKTREEMLQRERNLLLFTKPSALGEEKSGEDEGPKKDVKKSTVLKGSMGQRLMKDLAHIEERKKARAARQAQWKEFLESRLPDDYEDPSDLVAIQEAKLNIGDFKLKSANDYLVPQRVTTKTAKEKVIMHKLYIYEYKHNFNIRFMALRNKKMRIINRIRMNSAQLQKIHQQIPRRQAKAGPTAPNPHAEEFPEKRYEYTKATLQQWHEAYLAQQAAEGDQATGASPAISAAAEHIPHNIQPMTSLGSQDRTGEDAKDTFAAGGGRRVGAVVDISKQELSEIEKLMKRDDEIRLIFDQEVIIENMNDMIRNFDAELRCLRHDKFLLDISMKNAEARGIVLLRELLLLKELEKEENVLTATFDSRVIESKETRAKIEEMQNKIEVRRKEIEYLQGQEKALHTAFVNTIGENKFLPFLTKVFKKKIKRSRKLMLDMDDDDSDSDSDDDYSEISDSEDDDDDEDEDFQMELDICPPGCDKTLYDTTCSLREDRLDIEEAMTAERKGRDSLIKELEISLKNAKKIEAALDVAEQDLEDFQLKKQKGLNAVDCTVTFKLHQLEYLHKDGWLIMDFRISLAFEDYNLIRLQKRIKELQQEQKRQKKEKRESRLLHISLTQDRRLFDRQIDSMKETCDEMMVKKFGRLISLEKLETIIVNRELEELRQELHDYQASSELELFRWQNRLSFHQCKQREFLKHNTVLNEYLVKLTTDGARLEQTLDNRQRNVGIEQMDDFTEELFERQQLTQLVSRQVDEMSEIKQEIWALSRKEGMVFPPNY